MGDLLFCSWHAPLFLSNTDNLLASHKQIMDKGAHVFVPGHGNIISKKEMKQFPEYIHAVEEVSTKLKGTTLPNDSSIAAMVPKKYEGFWLREIFFVPSVKSLANQ